MLIDRSFAKLDRWNKNVPYRILDKHLNIINMVCKLLTGCLCNMFIVLIIVYQLAVCYISCGKQSVNYCS